MRSASKDRDHYPSDEDEGKIAEPVVASGTCVIVDDALIPKERIGDGVRVDHSCSFLGCQVTRSLDQSLGQKLLDVPAAFDPSKKPRPGRGFCWGGNLVEHVHALKRRQPFAHKKDLTGPFARLFRKATRRPSLLLAIRNFVEVGLADHAVYPFGLVDDL